MCHVRTKTCRRQWPETSDLPGRVVDAVDVLLQAGALMIGESSRALVAAAHVDIHRVRHFCDFLPLLLVAAIQEVLLLAEAQGRVVSGSDD